MTQNELLKEELFNYLSSKYSEVKMEYMLNKIFTTERKFRADFYIPEINTIIEINGGQFINGRHNRGGTGYENDLIKSNLCQQNNIKYFQYTYQMLKSKQYENNL